MFSYWSSYFLKFLWPESSATCSVEGFKNSLKSSFVSWISSKAKDINESSKVEFSSDSCSIDDSENLACLALKV